MIDRPPDWRDATAPSQSVRRALALDPHPEGGFFREVWRDRPADGGRGAAASIYFLLEAGQRSHWHRVDASELWIWQAGASAQLGIAGADAISQIALGPSLDAGEQ